MQVEVEQAETQSEGTEKRARGGYYTYAELELNHPTMAENDLVSLWEKALARCFAHDHDRRRRCDPSATAELR